MAPVTDGHAVERRMLVIVALPPPAGRAARPGFPRCARPVQGAGDRARPGSATVGSGFPRLRIEPNASCGISTTMARACRCGCSRGVGQAAHLPARHGVGAQACDELFAREPAQPLRQFVDQGAPVPHAVGVGGIARVVQQIGRVDRRAELAPEPLVAGGDDHEPVPGPPWSRRESGCGAGSLRAPAPRPCGSRPPARQRQRRRHRVEQGDVDVLPLPAPVANRAAPAGCRSSRRGRRGSR